MEILTRQYKITPILWTTNLTEKVVGRSTFRTSVKTVSKSGDHAQDRDRETCGGTNSVKLLSFIVVLSKWIGR